MFHIRKSRVEYPYPEEFPGAFDSPNTSQWTANAALFYDTPKFSARVPLNYRSSYRLFAWTQNPDSSWYHDDPYRLAAAINYTPGKGKPRSPAGGKTPGTASYPKFGE